MSSDCDKFAAKKLLTPSTTECQLLHHILNVSFYIIFSPTQSIAFVVPLQKKRRQERRIICGTRSTSSRWIFSQEDERKETEQDGRPRRSYYTATTLYKLMNRKRMLACITL